jgi:hypothetical protein
MFMEFTTPLLAYLDPGMGSMVLQVTVAGLLSGMFFMRSSWGRVRHWLSGDRGARAGQ